MRRDAEQALEPVGEVALIGVVRDQVREKLDEPGLDRERTFTGDGRPC